MAGKLTELSKFCGCNFSFCSVESNNIIHLGSGHCMKDSEPYGFFVCMMKSLCSSSPKATCIIIVHR